MGLEKIKSEFEDKKYRFFGNSSVQICTWSKKALKGQGACYKQKFYGVPTHQCMQFSPTTLYCQNNCIYCWRPAEFLAPAREVKWDAPDEMVEALIKKRVKLLEGFGGNPEADKKLFLEANIPIHFAISLSGEPTLYPKLPELVKYLVHRKGTFSVFIVTNGQEPAMLEKLELTGALPTQLYLSLTATTEADYKKISVPLHKDGWERILKSIHFLSKVPTRTVLRITFIKGMNMKNPKGWANLINKANPHFVEFKAYMHIGFSQYRMKRENMPIIGEVREFSEKILKHLPNFEVMDEDISSRIIVLKNRLRKTEKKIMGPMPAQNGF